MEGSQNEFLGYAGAEDSERPLRVRVIVVKCKKCCWKIERSRESVARCVYLFL